MGARGTVYVLVCLCVYAVVWWECMCLIILNYTVSAQNVLVSVCCVRACLYIPYMRERERERLMAVLCCALPDPSCVCVLSGGDDNAIYASGFRVEGKVMTALWKHSVVSAHASSVTGLHPSAHRGAYILAAPCLPAACAR